MERGDCSLISEAAFTGCFNFKEGSPLDQEYRLRLKLALDYLIKKRIKAVLSAKLIYNTLICLQRTVANASELAGDIAKNTLNKYVNTVLDTDSTDEPNQIDMEESIIDHYKAIYEQLYGTDDEPAIES